MRFLRIGNPIAVGVTPQLIHYTGSDILAHVWVCGGDDWSDWRCGQVVQCEFIQTREVRVDATDAHVDSRKACFH